MLPCQYAPSLEYCIHILFNEYTYLIMVNNVVNNVVLVKQLPDNTISETTCRRFRGTKLGEVIETCKSDDTNM